MEYPKLTLNEIENYLGQAGRKSGSQYIWQCPHCLDKSRNNLTFNESKGLLYCFASDGEHSKQILKDMCSRNKVIKSTYRPIPYKNKNLKEPESNQEIFTKEKQTELLTYMYKCNDALLNHEKSLIYLENKRGLNRDTVAFCGIGIDLKTRKWVIPTFKYDLTESYITGFEFRPPDFKTNGLCRSKGTPTSMAMINCFTPKTEVLAIVEGYIDGYALYQHLNELGQAQFYHIVTPSNGVSSLLKYIHEVRFDRYKRCYLYIDNDDAGDKATAKILEEYPFLQSVTMNCGCKDFNEHYMKCIKSSP